MTDVDGSRKRPSSVDDEGPNQSKRQRPAVDLLRHANSDTFNIAAERNDHRDSQLETAVVSTATPETTAEGTANPGDNGVRCFFKEILKSAHHLIEKFADELKDLFGSDENSEDGDNSPEEEKASLGNNVHVPRPDYQGQFYRMGVHIKKERRGVKIAKLFEETIAHKAHLKESDIITHLDEVDLKEKELVEVLRMFGGVKKDFKLTILREVNDGEETHVKLTVHITISKENDEQTFEIDVKVWASKYQSNGQTSGNQYITQDRDDEPQDYMYESNGSLRMGGVTDKSAIFVLEFYIPIQTRDGQVCRIRNMSTSRVIDVTTNRAVLTSRQLASNSLFNKRYRPDGSYVFESIKYQGHFLTNNSGKIQLARHDDVGTVSLSSQFMLYEANRQMKPRNGRQNPTLLQQQRRRVIEIPTNL